MALTLPINHISILLVAILLRVLENIEPHELRECRSVSRTWTPLATSLFFKTFVFHFNRRSVGNLAQIASSKGLAKHVQTLVLWRGPKLGLRGFNSFEAWEECLELLDGDDTGDKGYPSNEFGDENSNQIPLMSKKDWYELTYAERLALYRDYKEEREMTSDVREHLIKEVKDALEKLTKLTELIHDPVIESIGKWTRRWKRLRFDH
jgi:hypothetical protein